TRPVCVAGFSMARTRVRTWSLGDEERDAPPGESSIESKSSPYTILVRSAQGRPATAEKEDGGGSAFGRSSRLRDSQPRRCGARARRFRLPGGGGGRARLRDRRAPGVPRREPGAEPLCTDTERARGLSCRDAAGCSEAKRLRAWQGRGPAGGQDQHADERTPRS